MSDFRKSKEQLPSEEKFHSLLASRKVSEKIYEYILRDWNNFEMKTMEDHHDLYLKCDVLLLAGMFENFRNSSLKNYGLCPSHFLSAAASTRDIMVNMTKP